MLPRSLPTWNSTTYWESAVDDVIRSIHETQRYMKHIKMTKYQKLLAICSVYCMINIAIT